MALVTDGAVLTAHSGGGHRNPHRGQPQIFGRKSLTTADSHAKIREAARPRLSSKSNEPIQGNPQSASEDDLQVAQGGGLGDWIKDKFEDFTGIKNFREASEAAIKGDGNKAALEFTEGLLKVNPTSELTSHTDALGLTNSVAAKMLDKEINK